MSLRRTQIIAVASTIFGYILPMIVLYNTDISFESSISKVPQPYTIVHGALDSIRGIFRLFLFPLTIFDPHIINTTKFPFFTKLAGYASFALLSIAFLSTLYLIYKCKWIDKIFNVFLLLICWVPLIFYIGRFIGDIN